MSVLVCDSLFDPLPCPPIPHTMIMQWMVLTVVHVHALNTERFKRRNTPLRADQVRQEEEKKPSKQEIEAEKRKHKKELREERARLERNEVFQTLYHKQTLTPADVIFRSIRGDPSIDSTTFVVHYMDRFLGLMAVPFEEFEEGEIPCHRIQRFTRRVDNQEEIVWDRATRVNILGQCTATLEQTV